MFIFMHDYFFVKIVISIIEHIVLNNER
ncbi:hypothetical protein CNEO4_590036 [Clostridium neonatale]|nr:hypothetical protein CNEO4_590036 [Clostridium neonatale]